MKNREFPLSETGEKSIVIEAVESSSKNESCNKEVNKKEKCGLHRLDSELECESAQNVQGVNRAKIVDFSPNSSSCEIDVKENVKEASETSVVNESCNRKMDLLLDLNCLNPFSCPVRAWFTI